MRFHCIQWIEQHQNLALTFSHLTSTICLDSSHSSVAGRSSSTRWSLSVFRMDTGVSASIPTKSVRIRTLHGASPTLSFSSSGPPLRSFPTFDGESGCGAHALGWEGNSSRVLQTEVGQRETMHPAVGADPHLATGFDPEAVLVPHSFHIGVRQLHLERGRLPLQRLLVTQVPADGDLAGWRGRGGKAQSQSRFIFSFFQFLLWKSSCSPGSNIQQIGSACYWSFHRR